MKRRVILLFLAAGAAFPLASCDKQEMAGNPAAGGGEIRFEIAIDSPSGDARAVTAPDFSTAFETGDEIGLFAVRHAAGQTAPLAATGNYHHNVRLTYDGSAWKSDAGVDLYWPGGSDRLDFYAYYPYDAAVADPTNIAFSVSADQSAPADYSNSDLMLARAADKPRTTDAVPLTFSHALAMVQVEFKKDRANNIGPSGVLIVQLPQVAVEATLNLGAAAGGEVRVAAGGAKQGITMAATFSDEGTAYFYRALLPVQTIASGNHIVIRQFNESYSYKIPANAAVVAGAVKKYEVGGIPFIPRVDIPAGTFLMGSPAGEPGRDVNERQYQVTLTRGFSMGKYEVTNGQYTEFLNATGVGADAKGTVVVDGASSTQTFLGNTNWGVSHDGSKWVTGSSNIPVAYITWFGAKAYADWAGGSLPTEAQWEYACRAGTTTAYSFGTGDLGDYAWYRDNSGGQTRPVGQKKPNPWGLYDTYGNVLEWCNDWFGVYPSTAVTDPTGPDSGSARVARGGGWYSGKDDCRSASRAVRSVTNDIGFRVVFAQ